jgi:hypothetical protein
MVCGSPATDRFSSARLATASSESFDALAGGFRMPLPSFGGCRGLASVALAIVALGVRSGAAAPAEMPAIIPPNALAFVEAVGVGAQLESLRASEVVAAVLASPQYRRYEGSADYARVQAVRTIVERQLGCDAWTAAERLLGGHLAFALYAKPEFEGYDLVAILRTRDPNAISDLRERLEPLLVLASEQIRRTEALAGVEKLSFPNEAGFLAWKDNWFVVATSEALLDEALARLHEDADDAAVGLAGDAAYVSMTESVDWRLPPRDAPSQRVLRAYVDLKQLNKATGGRLAPEKLDNPLGSLLFGDIVALLRTSPFAAVTIDVAPQGASVEIALARDAQQMPEPYLAFAPAEGPGLAPPPRVPKLLGAFAMYRDFAQWYVHREDLLQEQVLPGFDQFESGLANVLPGRDVGEDVLPLFGKRLYLVAAPQDYAQLDGEPGLKLPGFALVIELAEPEEGTALLQVFFQTIAALSNLQAGQQGRQPWVVTSETYHDVQVSFAQYLQKPSGKDLGVVYNFLPSSARVDDWFIMSSSLSLCRHLIDELQHPEADGEGDGPPQTTLAELHWDSLAEIVESNAEFIEGRIVQDGRTAEEAASELAAVVDLLKRFDTLEATTEAASDVFRIRVSGSWK